MSDRAIQEAIQKLSGTHLADKVYFIDAEVKSVDEAKRTCKVVAISGKSANEFTARLMASVDDGMLIVPVVGSAVVISMSDFNTASVVQYSEIEKIVFRGGDLGGLVKVIDLTTKLNNLENKLNSLVLKYNIHTHTSASPGSPTSPTTQTETGQLTPTQRSDIENLNITHG